MGGRGSCRAAGMLADAWVGGKRRVASKASSAGIDPEPLRSWKMPQAAAGSVGPQCPPRDCRKQDYDSE
jgi:hypothetical protein